MTHTQFKHGVFIATTGATKMDYIFEELPLLVDGDLEGGLVNGVAEIDGNARGDWNVIEIYLDGYGSGNKRKLMKLDHKSEIYGIIYDRLTDYLGRWYDDIDYKWRQDLEAQREAAAEDRWAARREER